MSSSVHPGQKKWIVLAVLLAMVLTSLDMTIVSTAMPSIIADLHGMTVYSWVFSAYLLTSTTPVPVYGKLADIYGRKKIFMFGTALFTVGSFLCTVAVNMPELIVFRAVQGLGAAGVLPVALTILGDIFTIEQRARVQGLFSGVWGTSAVAGPLAGAWIVEHSSWRWVFGINVPVGLLALVVLWLSFREQVQPVTQRIDWTGATLLTVGVTALLVSLMQTGGAAGAYAAGLTAVILLGLFVWWERRTPSPVLPLSLFRHRILNVSNLVNLFGGMVMFGLISYAPLMVQAVEMGTPTQAGQTLTPMLTGWPISAMVVGPLVLRMGFRRVGIIGGTLVAGGYGLFLFGPHTTHLPMIAGMVLIGAGFGLSLTGLLLAAQAAVDWNMRGVVTASSQFFRTIGGAVGVAFMGLVLNRSLQAQVLAHPRPGLTAGGLTEALLRHQAHGALLAQYEAIMSRGLFMVFGFGFAFAIVVFALVLAIPAGSAESWGVSEAGSIRQSG